MADHFILVEFLDPTVNSFLWRVREILGGRRYASPVHLTIRGPYEDERPEALDQAHDTLRYDVFEINGVGRFSNASEEVVFFRVNSPNLKSAWWKRDYPIEKYSFEPHITVYRGRDAKFADVVGRFLDLEKIRLRCAEHRVVWHSSRQPNLLSVRVPSVGDMHDLDTSDRVDLTVLDRLEEVVDRYRQAEHMGSRRIG